MSISIKGIRIESMDIQRDGTEGKMKVTGQYGLISNVDTVLAKQAINSYNGMVYTPSPDTEKLLRDFTQSVTSDLNKLLGLE